MTIPSTHRHAWTLCLLLSALVTACIDRDDNLNATPSQEFVYASYDLQQQRISIEANCPWRLSTSTTWLHVGKETGYNSESVAVMMDVNPSSTASRTGIVTITSNGGMQRSLKITQDASEAYLQLTPDSLHFSATNNTAQMVTVRSNGHWTAEAPDWVTLSATEATGDSTINIGVSNNEYENARTGRIVFKDGSGVIANIVVVQEGIDVVLRTGTEVYNIPAVADANGYNFYVVSNVDWTLSCSQNWIANLTPLQGSGEAMVHFTCESNTKETTKEAEIILQSNSELHRTRTTMRVVQAAGTRPEVGNLQLVSSDGTNITFRIYAEDWETFPISEYGVCYDTTANPERGNSTVVSAEGRSDGQAVYVTLEGLTTGQTYHARAYAINAVGISYSRDYEFKAMAIPQNGDIDRPQF